MEKKELDALLKLNQLAMTEEERARFLAGYAFRRELEKVMDDCDTAAVAPMVHVVGLVNVLREDAAEQSITRERLQEGAPEAADGYWQVPRLLD